jgi:phosphoglycolate phosphatase-like HAD superfamily hydrolase
VTTLAATVIFDMDGVLTDSKPTSLAALANVYADYGHEVSAGQLNQILGKHIDDAARLLSREHPIPLTPVQTRDSYLGRYLRHAVSIRRYVCAEPGAHPLFVTVCYRSCPAPWKVPAEFSVWAAVIATIGQSI